MDTEEKGKGGEGRWGEESAAFTMIQSKHFTPTGTPYIRIREAKYLEKLLCKSQYIYISAFKNVTLIMLEISPNLARDIG